MRQFLRALLVGPDDKPDEQAIISLSATAMLYYLEVYSVVWLHNPFDMVGFGTAVAGIGFHRACTAYANNKEGA